MKIPGGRWGDLISKVGAVFEENVEKCWSMIALIKPKEQPKHNACVYVEQIFKTGVRPRQNIHMVCFAGVRC